MLGVEVFRREREGMSSHYLVNGRLRESVKRKRAKQIGTVQEVLEVSEIDKGDKLMEYDEKLEFK